MSAPPAHVPADFYRSDGGARRMSTGLSSVGLSSMSYASSVGASIAGPVGRASVVTRPPSWSRAHATDMQHAPREPLNGGHSQPTYGLGIRTARVAS